MTMMPAVVPTGVHRWVLEGLGCGVPSYVASRGRNASQSEPVARRSHP